MNRYLPNSKIIFLVYLLIGIFLVNTNVFALDEIKKLTHSDAEDNDRMTAVAIDGDYAVAGVKNGDGAGADSNTGAVYVYYRNQGGADNWGEQAKLVSNDIAASDFFGYTVAISGDYIVVGAYGDDHNGSSTAGSAYVFQRSGTTWTQVAKLTSSDIGADDHFGEDVAIHGDYVVVGAPRWDGTDDSVDGVGAAYIYEKPGSGWTDMTETARISATGGVASLSFGEAVGVSGDYIVCGAYGYDDPSTVAGWDGAGYVFYRNAGVWTQQAVLTAPSYTQYDRLGHHAASISGDYVVLGGQGHDGVAESSGSAYVFYRNQGGANNWGHQATLNSLVSLEERDNFGVSVHIAGDWVIVGADSDDDDGSASGCGYLFYRNGTSWIASDKLLASDGEENDYKGKEHASCISCSGYAILGAEGEDGPTGDGKDTTGAAYLYQYGTPSIDTPTHTSVSYTSATLGATVSGDGGSAILQRGVVWSTSANPTTSSNQGSNTSSGTTGTFTVSATSLTPGTVYNYRGYATNANGTSYTANQTFTTSSYVAPTVTTTTATSVSYTTASSGGNVTSDGGRPILARGVVWGTSADPTVPSTNSTSDGTGTGLFSSSLSSLSDGTTYHYRAYATNSVGTSYGDDLTFTTDAYSAPVVTTPTATSVNSRTATLGGTVDSDGGQPILERGVVWSVLADPTTSVNDGSETASGTTGIFTVDSNGLTPATTYHYRAYARNSQGTTYTSDTTFTTESLITISGTISDGSAPIAGATVSFSNSGGTTTTAADGTYTHQVDYNWSGTVTPYAAGYDFSPANRTYTNIQANSANQDFTGSIAQHNVYVTWSGNGTVTNAGSPSAPAPVGNSFIVTLSHGSSTTIVYTANSGWFTSQVKINNIPDAAAVAAGSHTFTNVVSDQSIHIVFLEETGELQVNLSPSSAVTSGAKWKITGGTWKNSGEIVSNLAAGPYTVEFQEVTGYLTPSSKTVTVNAGSKTTAEGVYTKNGSAPAIRYFTASQSLVGSGDQVTLRWEVENADEITIDNGLGIVAGNPGEQDVRINNTTSFRLQSENAFGTSSSTVTVTVGTKPEILWFQTSNDESNPVTVGGEATLNWGVKGATDIEIVTAGAVPSTLDDQNLETGFKSVKPDQTTTYEIRATNQLGTSTSEVTVGVTELPEIISFQANPANIVEGDDTEFSWKVEGAVKLEITPDVGTLNNNNGKLKHRPSETTTYQLKAENGSGRVTSEVTVEVQGKAESSDLSISILDAVTAPAVNKVLEGKNAKVTVEIENIGEDTAKSFYVRLFDGSRVINDIFVSRLKAGVRKELVFDWVPLKEGRTTLSALVDPEMTLLESSLANNSDKLKVRIKKVSEVDLVVSDIKLSNTPDKDYLLLQFTVSNVGSSNSDSFQYTAWLNKNKAGEKIIVNNHFNSLKKNTSVVISKLLKLSDLKNRIKVTVGVDVNDVVKENNEENNYILTIFKKKDYK